LVYNQELEVWDEKLPFHLLGAHASSSGITSVSFFSTPQMEEDARGQKRGDYIDAWRQVFNSWMWRKSK
jgi:hypothetical protein